MKLLATFMLKQLNLANEVQSFKYWKANKSINREKALEEFADMLHFVGSFAYKYNVDPDIEPLILSDNVNKQICLLFSTISQCNKQFKQICHISDVIAYCFRSCQVT
ncbi:dUTP diphosphatase [Mycoplasmopsis bovis]|nr:dUTP diphosphatase [Mycoplasmopsis bovis]